MLHIFLCPKCFNYRIVSRKPDPICFHCGATLLKSDINYVEYIDMSKQERESYKEKFINRMKMYQENIETILTEPEKKSNTIN